jgi:hypothetical protein
MSASVKTKLCWNCEARVERQQEHCSYCGVYLSPEFTESSSGIPSPLYQTEEVSTSQEPGSDGEYGKEEPSSRFGINSSLNGMLFALAFLFFGTTFFLFSVALALFSEDGVLTLHWNSHLWPFLFIASLASLFVGWQLTAKVLD